MITTCIVKVGWAQQTDQTCTSTNEEYTSFGNIWSIIVAVMG